MFTCHDAPAASRVDVDTPSNIPALAQLGTREYPHTASNETANRFQHMLGLRANLQGVAKGLLADGSRVDWEFVVLHWARIGLWLAPGFYENEDMPARRWAPITAENFLRHGRHAPFKNGEHIPPRIVEKVERGIRAALACPYEPMSREMLAERLNITAAFRRRHKLWQLAAIDMDAKELRRETTRLYRARRSLEQVERDQAASRAAKARTRNAEGAKSRAEIIESSVAEQAREMDVKPNTLRTRMRRAAKRVPPAEGDAPINIDTSKSPSVDGTSTITAPPARPRAAGADQPANTDKRGRYTRLEPANPVADFVTRMHAAIEAIPPEWQRLPFSPKPWGVTPGEPRASRQYEAAA